MTRLFSLLMVTRRLKYGIVRDITVDQLTQAVNNIDTSTLAQDSTLQDVVTAISNISGGSDPVTNTTVNTLGKDTSLQSIAGAITGLGTALGSDKANISGNNIADKATFRSNIEVNKVFYSTGGIYRTNRNTVNTPTSNYYVVLTLVFNENSDLSQLAIDVNFATLFVRSFHDGTTWTAWKRCDNI